MMNLKLEYKTNLVNILALEKVVNDICEKHVEELRRWVSKRRSSWAHILHQIWYATLQMSLLEDKFQEFAMLNVQVTGSK